MIGKQTFFGLWFGIGCGYNRTITGGNINGTTMTFVTEDYVFLFFKYSICTGKVGMP